ncbi:hypothetical protein JCM15124A_04630 [Prevotella falsenii]
MPEKCRQPLCRATARRLIFRKGCTDKANGRTQWAFFQFSNRINTKNISIFVANKPKSVIKVLYRFCSIVEQMCRHFIEGVARYDEPEWLHRCRQADETGEEA